MEIRRPRFEAADGRDVVGALSVDVASVGAPPGSNISAVSVLLSVSITSVRRSNGPVKRTAGLRVRVVNFLVMVFVYRLYRLFIVI